MNVSSGITPLDERTGGLRSGGLYLLAGMPGPGRLAFLLQFLDRGLKDGERVAFLCSSPPQDTIEQARVWGMDLSAPWLDGRLVLVGFRDKYPERAIHSPDPAELFAELGKLLGGPISRLAIDPGTLLWEARADSSMAGTFVAWSRELGATTFTAVPIELDDRQRVPTEWVAQRARGILQITTDSSGLHEIEIVRFAPAVPGNELISLELAEGLGLVRPGGRVERREAGRPASDRLLLLELEDSVPPELKGWLDRRHAVEVTRDSRDCVGRIRSDTYGALCVYTKRGRIQEAIDTGRSARQLTDAVLLLLSDEPLRAADAARALDAGFDDVLSGVVDLRELESRFRRAAGAPHSRQLPEAERPAPVTDPLDEAGFRTAVTGRLIEEGLCQFSLLYLEAASGDEIGSLLFQNSRAGDGDIVGPMRHGWGVLLQDARGQQAEAFLQRLRMSIAEFGGSLPLSAEILAAPEQSERIRALLDD